MGVRGESIDKSQYTSNKNTEHAYYHLLHRMLRTHVRGSHYKHPASFRSCHVATQPCAGCPSPCTDALIFNWLKEEMPSNVMRGCAPPA